MNPTFRRSARTLLLTACLWALVLATGCSRDRHVFRSTALTQKSVSVVSQQTGDTLWTKDIPVNQQLLLDFDRNGRGRELYASPNIPATGMAWELWSGDAIVEYGSKRKGGRKLDSGKVKLPGQPVTIAVKVLQADRAVN